MFPEEKKSAEEIAYWKARKGIDIEANQQIVTDSKNVQYI